MGRESTSIYIIDPEGAEHPLYSSWTNGLSYAVKEESCVHPSWRPPADAALLVSRVQCVNPWASILEQVRKEGRCGTLVIADGILEYRNTFQHPGLPAGSMYQPVMGHKLACIGRSQARVVKSWGGLGVCECVGSPRFDQLLNCTPRSRKKGEPLRLLVATAKTPGFTKRQIELCRQALCDIREATEEPTASIEVTWRIADSVSDVVDARRGALKDTTGAALAEVLSTVDAMITTPSTAMLEGMLQGIPVALLDYTNSPQYVPAAWTISAREHISWVLQELHDPPTPKMLYQSYVLKDALESHSPAAPRMVELVEKMAKQVEDCRVSGKAVEFPDSILNDVPEAHAFPDPTFNLNKLYPRHREMAVLEREELQVEVERSRAEVKAMIECLQRFKTSPDWMIARALSWPVRKAIEWLR